MKKCTGCEVTKNSDEFAKDGRNKSGLGARCKECVYRRSRRWTSANRERSNAYYRRYNAAPSARLAKRSRRLEKEYGITHADYERMLDAQRGVCALCEGPSQTKDGFYQVDHDHKTGKVRSLLCQLCNTALGSFRDDPTLIRAAARYVERWRCT